MKVSEEGIVSPRRLDTPTLCTFDAAPSTRAKQVAFGVAAVAYDVGLLALLLASCASVVSGSFNPFIYFQF